MTDTFDVDANSKEIRRIGAELAALCQLAYLTGDLSVSSALIHAIEDEIIEILDRDMAVDPIEHAVERLRKAGNADALAELAYFALRHRNDRGEWGK